MMMSPAQFDEYNEFAHQTYRVSTCEIRAEPATVRSWDTQSPLRTLTRQPSAYSRSLTTR